MISGSYLYDYLNEGESWTFAAQVFRSQYNAATYGDPYGTDFIHLSDKGASVTVYEGDLVKIYFGAFNTDDFIERAHAGMFTDATLEVSGLYSSDVNEFNYGGTSDNLTHSGDIVELSLENGYFVSYMSIIIQTGGEEELMTNAASGNSFWVYNNDEEDGVQELDISTIFYNPEYDFVTDSHIFIEGSTSITYIDTADVTEENLPWNASVFEYGTSGRDLMKGSEEDDAFAGKGGRDVIKGFAGEDDLIGGNGADTLYGGKGQDRLQGGNGDDALNGGKGDDQLFGGKDDDTLQGGGGNDDLYGNKGVDLLLGQGGNDELYGGNGRDELIGGGGADHLYGGNGDDLLYGNGDNDALYGGKGDDTLKGGAGIDRMWGGNGKDTLIGGGGLDTLYGGAGSDTLKGGAGADTLYGGKGNDTLTGGADGDIFVFDGDSSQDRILDFDFFGDFDFIRFDDGPDSFDDLTVGGDADAAVISWDGGSVTLVGYDVADVQSFMFFFE